MPAVSIQETKASLDRELLRLENKDKSSYTLGLEEQAMIQRKLNAINSPAHSLPVEALVHIFLYTVSLPPRPSSFDKWIAQQSQARELAEIFFSVTLAAVCHLWRSVAFSLPDLWTHFEYPEFLWTRKRNSRHLLSLYLHNSKHLPICLSLSFSATAPEDTLFHPSLDRSLMSNSTRISHLSLLNPPLRWLKQLGNLPFLVDLSVDWRSRIPSTAVDWRPGISSTPHRYRLDYLHLHRSRALSHLSLQNAVTIDDRRVLYRIPTSLTVLNLSKIPIDVCIKIMLRCCKLVEAYVHRPQSEHDNYSSPEELRRDWFPEPVIFKHLTTLLWYHNGDTWSDAFLEQMHTPQLHTLKLTSAKERKYVIDLFGPGDRFLVEQLPTTLKTLEIEDTNSICTNTLGRLTNDQSPVEHLVLTGCHVDAFLDVFKALLEIEGTSGSKYLPQLKSLSIRGFMDEHDSWAADLNTSRHLGPLIESLELRLGQGDGFKLEISGIGVDWTPGVQIRLRGLIGRGVRLEIIEDGDPVEWLLPS